MRLIHPDLSSPHTVEAILTAPSPMSSTFTTVSRRRRDTHHDSENNVSMMGESSDHDIQQLSTLAESSLCISLEQEVTSCRELAVLPAAKGKGMYSGQLPTVHTASENDDLTADIGKLAMENHPFDEPSPTPSSYMSVGGVPGFPDFDWVDDATTRTANNNNSTEDWQERRRMESILAAATPIMTPSGVRQASMRLEHQRSLRKLRKLRRKSVNLAVRGSKRHRRLLEAMEVEGKDKYHHDGTTENVIEWARERTGTAKATERYRSQCRNRRSNNKNHIHKVKKSVRGWRHDFHIRRFEMAKTGDDDKAGGNVNTSKLGQDDFAKRNRQQRALNDLQREMSYLGL